MRQQQMTRLIHSLPQLTHHQRQQLASCLQALMDRNQASALIEAHASDTFFSTCSAVQFGAARVRYDPVTSAPSPPSASCSGTKTSMFSYHAVFNLVIFLSECSHQDKIAAYSYQRTGLRSQSPQMTR